MTVRARRCGGVDSADGRKTLGDATLVEYDRRDGQGSRRPRRGIRQDWCGPLMCLAAIGRVVAVRKERGILHAEIDVNGRAMLVGAGFTPELRPGMYAVVHAGLAMQALTPDEAAEALAMRAAMTAIDDQAS